MVIMLNIVILYTTISCSDAVSTVTAISSRNCDYQRPS